MHEYLRNIDNSFRHVEKAIENLSDSLYFEQAGIKQEVFRSNIQDYGDYNSHLDYYEDIKDYEKQIEITKNFTQLLVKFKHYFRKDNVYSCQSVFNNLINLTAEDCLEEILESNDLDLHVLTDSIQLIIDNILFDETYISPNQLIPENIKELNEEILYQISRHPELMHSIEPFLFEELIRKILLKLKAELTKRTRDGGIDIIAFEDNMFSKNKYIIECKRYNSKKKVTNSIVERLYGIKQSQKATKALLVTSSSFTKPAKDFADQHPWELELIDYNQLVYWLQHFWK
ncbi:restriction endonuclease [Marinifilum flexuosum]|uniref:restriction endonuclease n=1 Tax=Marinifilum flexuosum TaxID=1117708 RepID=UPI0024900DCD|nr:restriction endonuclease [Marinifilum flexuosum]